MFPLKFLNGADLDINKSLNVWIEKNKQKLKGLNLQLLSRYKHSYEDKVVGVIHGLEQFKKTLNFVTSDKPSKQEKPKRKQKRNDYED